MPNRLPVSRLRAISPWAVLLFAAGLGGCDTADRAPEAEFTSILGQRFATADLRGAPVLVSFWATDCRPCLEELPELTALHRDYAPRGFRLVAVAMPYDVPSRVVDLAKAQQLPFDVVLDPLGKIAAAFGSVVAVPTAFLIASDGRIVERSVGKLSAETVRRHLDNW